MRSYPRMSDDTIQLLAAIALAAALAMALGYATRAEAADTPTTTTTAKTTVVKEDAPPATTTPAPTPAPAVKPSRPPISPAAKENAVTASPSSTTSAPKASTPKAKPATKLTISQVSNSSADSDSGMTLRGGAERTDFRTMTVEGEDRVHVEVERPALQLQLDPEKVAGLELGTARDVLNRTAPDLTTSYYSLSSSEPSPYLGRPWLRQFATGSVATFEPKMEKVDRWKLVVADSKGQTVTTFQGSGDPPKQIAWNGRTQSGSLVTPGLTYSYYLEAYDRAGNKRNFVGEGFKISAYRVDTASGPVMVFSGLNLLGTPNAGRVYGPGASARATSPILLEAASWINQSSQIAQPIRVTVTARGYDQANLLSKQVAMAMAKLTLGDPNRVQSMTEVVPDAPDGGTVRIGLGVGPEVGSGQVAPAPVSTKDQKKEASKKQKK
jgi:hypothetical protein